MARSLSNAKLISAMVVDTISIAVGRRGYTAASQGGVLSSAVRGGGAASNVMSRKGVEDSAKNSPWVPDPITGYYRPENHANEIDTAELREMLLKHQIPKH